MNTLAMRNFSLLALLPEIIDSPKPKAETQTKSFETAVNGLAKFDLSYVYHHLYVGRKLTLKVEDTKVGVYYRASKLGELPFLATRKLMRYIDNDYNVQIEISKMKKSQYLPITDLELELKFQKNS